MLFYISNLFVFTRDIVLAKSADKDVRSVSPLHYIYLLQRPEGAEEPSEELCSGPRGGGKLRRPEAGLHREDIRADSAVCAGAA